MTRRARRVQPRFYPDATILFADICHYSHSTQTAEPATLIGLVDSYSARFDEIVAETGVEKLKTIGDVYLAVAGVPATDRLKPEFSGDSAGRRPNERLMEVCGAPATPVPGR